MWTRKPSSQLHRGPQRSLQHALARVGTIVATVGMTIWYLVNRTWEYPLLVAAIATSTLLLIDARDLYARLSRVEILVMGVILGGTGAIGFQWLVQVIKSILEYRTGVIV